METADKTKILNSKAVYAMIIGLGLILTFFVGYLVINNDSSSDIKPIPEVVTKSTDNPDETPITEENYEWKGKDSDPKYISLTSIKAGGYIQKVSVDQRNEVGVPSNVNLAGWFKDSSIPGNKGLSVIDGHVDGLSKPGIFKNIEKLKVNDVFSIEYGNGSTKKFRVTSKTKASIADAPSILFSQDPIEVSQLNLITCGGTYDKKARRYLERIIVTSVPVSAT